MFLISRVKRVWDTHCKLIVTLEYMVTDLEIKVCAGKHDHQKTTSFCAYIYTCILVIKCNGCLILLRNSANILSLYIKSLPNFKFTISYAYSPIDHKAN
jgi:hypothetical protein